ncbi:magnesium/cobalt transporter CorA [Candidatus Protochlamydia sp. R18]|uniref:magnesium/cobalt transporter CorA n=1 Tax=Candidatus Protochlamydia sp. R18 TaxID=1353977 RepID=UPI0005AB763E|nr:magnesium/cobalt transporter CorA [Candidatus Protochlamydia sp. R18]
MYRLLKNRIKKTGLSPGSLIPIGEKPPHEIKLSIIEYSESEFIEKENVSIEECLDHLTTPNMTWIQVFGVYDPASIASIGKRFDLHALIQEDILNTSQRPKLDIYQNQVFIVARFLKYNQQEHQIQDEQISLIFGENLLISFLEQDKDVFISVKERLRQGNVRIRKQKADYLAYALLDTIVDHYFIVLEKIDTNLDHLEEELVRSPKPGTLQSIQRAKQEIAVLKRSIWPMREVVNRFQRIEPPLVNTHTQIFLKDLYDHIIQNNDIIDGFRDVVSGMLDIYLSNINIRSNEIMKVLTIVSTIFVPLTFISSIYGMNFDSMPELHYPFGYPLIMLFMLTLSLLMLHYFRQKKWI